MLKEVNYLIKVFKDTKGEPLDPSDSIYASFANINLSMVVGNRREHDDSVFVKLRQILTEATTLHLRLSVLLNCIPFLKHFPRDVLGLRKIQGWTDFIGQFATNMYNDHNLRHRNCDLKGSCPRRDMMDIFICEINRAARKNQPTDFTLDQLKVLIGELLGAASESPTTFLRWAILYLLHFPDIKDRIQKDIKHALGKRQPTFDDMSGLPYVEAFICEVLRIANVVPFAMPHACFGDSDVEWEGYTIPKDCTVLFNLDSVLKDPDLFNNPESFDPSRFLDSSGNIVKTKGFIPFGTGRRICPGENISWIEMFLFITVLIQEFDFIPKETNHLPTLEGIVSLGYSPRPFEIRVVSKKS